MATKNREASNNDKDRVETVEGFNSVLSAFSEDALTKAKDAAYKMVSEDLDINRICSVLVTSRQLYALARLALHRQLEAEGHEWHDGVEETLIKAMANKSEQAFERTKVAKQLETAVKQFISEELVKELEEERAARMDQKYRLNQIMLSRKVVLNNKEFSAGDTVICITTQSTATDLLQKVLGSVKNIVPETTSSDALPDGLSLIQLSSSNVISLTDATTKQDATSNISGTLQENTVEVLTAMEPQTQSTTQPITIKSLPKSNSENSTGRPYIKEIPVSLWEDSASDHEQISSLVGSVLHSMNFDWLDLLVVTDLGKAAKPKINLTGTYVPKVPYRVATAVKSLRRVAKDNNAVLLGFVPTLASEIENTIAAYKDDYKAVPGVHIISSNELL